MRSEDIYQIFSKVKILNNRISIEGVIFSSFIAVSLYVFLFSRLFSSNLFPLLNFPDRAIGIAVLSAIDAQGRTQFYVEIIGITVLFFFVLLRLLSSFSLMTGGERFNYENELIFHSSLFGIASLFFFKYTADNNYLTVIILMYGVILYALVLHTLKNSSLNNCRIIQFFLENSTFNVVMLLVPYPLLFAIYSAIGKPCQITIPYVICYIFTYFFIMCFLYKLFNYICRNKGESKNFLNYSVVSTTPLFLIPFSGPIASEIQYIFRDSVGFQSQIFSLVFSGLLLFFSAFLLVYQVNNNQILLHQKKILEFSIFPLFFASLSFFQNYRDYLTISFDMFHHGEWLLPIQQFSEHGVIPFIQIYVTHGLSSIYFQWLYAFIHGYIPVEVALWQWITPVLGTVLLYFFFRKFTGIFFTCFALFSLPIVGLFSGPAPYYYIVIILGILTLGFFIQQPSLRRWEIVLITLMFILLWRVDFGVSLILTTCALLLVLGIKKIRLNNKYFLRDIKDYVKISAITFGISGLIFFIAIISSGQQIWDFLIINLQMLRFQDAVMTYPGIIKTFNVEAIIQYIIFPLCGVGYIAWYALKYLQPDQKFSEKETTVAIIFIFSLIISIRGVQRHSQIESFSYFLFILGLFLIPFLILKYTCKERKIAAIAVLCIFAVIVHYPLNLAHSDLATPFFTYHTWEKNEARILSDEGNYSKITSFITDNVKDDKTFFDFSNSPMLYILTHKRHIPYVIPNLYQTSEIIQNQTLKNLIFNKNQGNLPIIIFKQPINWWNNVDGVPNEVRSYRISEFIYEHYIPYGNVSHYQIWVEKNEISSFNSNNDFSNNYVELTKNPAVTCHNCIVSGENSLIINSSEDDPYCSNLFDIPAILQTKNPSDKYLNITYKSSKSGQIQFFFQGTSDYNEKDSVKAEIRETKNSSSTISVEIPLLISEIRSVRIDPPDNASFEILNAAVYIEKIVSPITKINQNFDLMYLPYVWGTYDKKLSHTSPKILRDLISESMDVQKGDTINLLFDPVLPGHKGNYVHLTIYSPEQAQVNLSIGDEGNSIRFNTISSQKLQSYLIRISTLWAWYSENINQISINSTSTITVEKAQILEGD